ncbi:MAG: CBS domain-containing protein [Nitrospinaceae bacterium]|nr:CBS domain-containing protein [Nitrospinaceae bacterium]NIT80552.1 CBS domain-containing protein [Nitrospinaceae bacterium]NIW04467.1 CBS domain-containing protein [Nitrospinaceae bacterium]NIX32960.1 CBS domain-containing protein [Nitrospinaceae bacterium]
MHSKNVGSLLVKDKEDYVGIVTETNLSQTVVAKGLDSSTTKVSEVMSHPLLTLERSEQVEEANKFMAKHKIRHLGVTENGKIIGVLSVKDLVSYYANPRLRTW